VLNGEFSVMFCVFSFRLPAVTSTVDKFKQQRKVQRKVCRRTVP
jgi:hypothetical protein